MSFLKTLFWVVLSAMIVLFSVNNWLPVTINLWGGLQADVKIPVLMIFFFLIGFVPTFAYYRMKSWRLAKRLESTERQLADERGLRRFRDPPAAAAPEDTDAPAPQHDEPVDEEGPSAAVSITPIAKGSQA